MRIIIRGAAEIEIILPEGVEPPTVGTPVAVAGEASTGTVRSCTASSPGSPKQSRGTPIVRDGHAKADAERAAREGGRDTILADPTVADMLAKREAPADLSALVREIGAAVTAAVENPPPPVEPPAELALRRPVEEDDLAMPAFLDRRKRAADEAAA